MKEKLPSKSPASLGLIKFQEVSFALVENVDFKGFSKPL